MRGGRQATRAELRFAALRDTLAHFGHRSKASKEQPPCDVIDLLGVTLDLPANSRRLTDEKRRKYSERAREVAAMRRVPLADYSRLMGRLQFAAQCYPLGRQWLHAAGRVMRARFRLRACLCPREGTAFACDELAATWTNERRIRSQEKIIMETAAPRT